MVRDVFQSTRLSLGESKKNIVIKGDYGHVAGYGIFNGIVVDSRILTKQYIWFPFTFEGCLCSKTFKLRYKVGLQGELNYTHLLFAADHELLKLDGQINGISFSSLWNGSSIADMTKSHLSFNHTGEFSVHLSGNNVTGNYAVDGHDDVLVFHMNETSQGKGK